MLLCGFVIKFVANVLFSSGSCQFSKQTRLYPTSKPDLVARKCYDNIGERASNAIQGEPKFSLSETTRSLRFLKKENDMVEGKRALESHSSAFESYLALLLNSRATPSKLFVVVYIN